MDFDKHNVFRTTIHQWSPAWKCGGNPVPPREEWKDWFACFARILGGRLDSFRMGWCMSDVFVEYLTRFCLLVFKRR